MGSPNLNYKFCHVVFGFPNFVLRYMCELGFWFESDFNLWHFNTNNKFYHINSYVGAVILWENMLVLNLGNSYSGAYSVSNLGITLCVKLFISYEKMLRIVESFNKIDGSTWCQWQCYYVLTKCWITLERMKTRI